MLIKYETGFCYYTAYFLTTIAWNRMSPKLARSVKAFRLRSCVAQSIRVFVGVNIFWAKRKYHSQLFLFYLVFAYFFLLHWQPSFIKSNQPSTSELLLQITPERQRGVEIMKYLIAEQTVGTKHVTLIWFPFSYLFRRRRRRMTKILTLLERPRENTR